MSLRKKWYTGCCRALSANFIMVTGCQRSGTTLVFMMLAAHPAVRGYDESEMDFSFPSWRLLLKNRLGGRRTCIKHPMATPYANWMRSEFPRAHSLFVLRHPCGAIASMRSLTIYDGQNWLQRHARHELSRHRDLYPELAELNLETMNDIEAGAHVWRAKRRALCAFRGKGLPVSEVCYETLLEAPERELRRLLGELDLPWSNRVLSHERFQARAVFAGNTRGDKPLDPARARSDWNFTAEELERIRSICGEEMKLAGYELT